MAEMREEAREIVEAATDEPLGETRRAYVRYVGQGYEIAVEVPAGGAAGYGREALHAAFEAAYRALYGRVIPDLDIEVLSWTLTLGADPAALSEAALAADVGRAAEAPPAAADLYDPGLRERLPARRFARESLAAGTVVEGPALIVEAQTTTVLSPGFHARVSPRGDILMERTETGAER